jgi:hypothetical protein
VQTQGLYLHFEISGVKEHNIFFRYTEETWETANEILRTAPGDENLR